MINPSKEKCHAAMTSLEKIATVEHFVSDEISRNRLTSGVEEIKAFLTSVEKRLPTEEMYAKGKQAIIDYKKDQIMQVTEQNCREAIKRLDRVKTDTAKHCGRQEEQDLDWLNNFITSVDLMLEEIDNKKAVDDAAKKAFRGRLGVEE